MNEFITLPVPVPPMLEQAIGYEGQARLVAFYWIPSGDEVYFDDGHVGSTGEWDAYLTFMRHPVIAPALQGHNLGDSETEADEWMILDRIARCLFVAPKRTAERWLSERWPHEQVSESVTMTQEEMMQAVMDALNIENWTQVQTTIATSEIMRKMRAHRQLVAQLQAWLELH